MSDESGLLLHLAILKVLETRRNSKSHYTDQTNNSHLLASVLCQALLSRSFMPGRSCGCLTSWCECDLSLL